MEGKRWKVERKTGKLNGAVLEKKMRQRSDEPLCFISCWPLVNEEGGSRKASKVRMRGANGATKMEWLQNG